MFEKLDALIEHISEVYANINLQWKEIRKYSFNLRNKTVFDLKNNSDIWSMLQSYRSFIEESQLDILWDITDYQTEECKITSRIKQQNSVQYKMYKFLTGSLNGKVPINKCFNDLLGFRIVIDYKFTHDDIALHIQEKFPNLKIIDSSNKDYIASHVYFMEDNTLFPWELQIWCVSNQLSNLKSHKVYKQNYTIWEKKYLE